MIGINIKTGLIILSTMLMVGCCGCEKKAFFKDFKESYAQDIESIDSKSSSFRIDREVVEIENKYGEMRELKTTAFKLDVERLSSAKLTIKNMESRLNSWSLICYPNVEKDCKFSLRQGSKDVSNTLNYYISYNDMNILRKSILGYENSNNFIDFSLNVKSHIINEFGHASNLSDNSLHIDKDKLSYEEDSFLTLRSYHNTLLLSYDYDQLRLDSSSAENMGDILHDYFYLMDKYKNKQLKSEIPKVEREAKKDGMKVKDLF